MRCCFCAVQKTQAGSLDVERNALETQSLTLTQAALLEATVCFVVFQRCDPTLFFLSFFMIVCDWELEEIELGSFSDWVGQLPSPLEGWGWTRAAVNLHYGVPYTGLLRHVFIMALMGVGQVSCS